MTSRERLPRLLAALNVLLDTVPANVHDGNQAGCDICAAIAQTEADVRSCLGTLRAVVAEVHMDAEGYMYDCSVCEALREAERVLQDMW